MLPKPLDESALCKTKEEITEMRLGGQLLAPSNARSTFEPEESRKSEAGKVTFRRLPIHNSIVTTVEFWQKSFAKVLPWPSM
jgi:hypothetical protein